MAAATAARSTGRWCRGCVAFPSRGRRLTVGGVPRDRKDDPRRHRAYGTWLKQSAIYLTLPNDEAELAIDLSSAAAMANARIGRAGKLEPDTKRLFPTGQAPERGGANGVSSVELGPVPFSLRETQNVCTASLSEECVASPEGGLCGAL